MRCARPAAGGPSALWRAWTSSFGLEKPVPAGGGNRSGTGTRCGFLRYAGRMVARELRAVVLAAACLTWAGGVAAQVVQTDAAQTPLPQPVGPDELNLITNSWARNTMTQSWKDPLTGMQLTA